MYTMTSLFPYVGFMVADFQEVDPDEAGEIQWSLFLCKGLRSSGCHDCSLTAAFGKRLQVILPG